MAMQAQLLVAVLMPIRHLLCTQYKTVSVERGEGTDKRQGYAAPECLLSMCQPS